MATLKCDRAPAELLRERFSETMRAARLAAGLTQVGLSKATGINQATLSLFERGLRVPDLDQLAVIADALDVRPGQLLSDLD